MEAKKNLRARKYSSPIIKEVLSRVTEGGKAQSRLRLTIAARIDDYRIARGWSKTELAQKLHRQPSEITKWMSGTHNFTMDTLVEIAIAFEIDIKALMEYYGQEKKVQAEEINLQSSHLAPIVILMTPSMNQIRCLRQFQVSIPDTADQMLTSIYSDYNA